MNRHKIIFAVMTLGMIFRSTLLFAESDAEKCKQTYGKDNKRAYSYCLKAAELGDLEAQTTLGELYEADKKFADAENWYLKAAEQGYAEAQYKLGFLFCLGDISQNFKNPDYWFNKAANQGHEWAEASLNGACKTEEYLNNYLIIHHTNEANKGMVFDQRLLAHWYAEGTNPPNLPQNFKKTFYWYTQAATAGDAYSQFELGKLLEDGKGTLKNDILAFAWYEKAAGQGNTTHQFQLAKKYLEQKKPELAYRWFLKASEQGDDSSQAMLGILLLTGEGVAKNYNEALKWLRASSDLNNPFAQQQLGLIFLKGEIIPRDLTQSLMWFILASSSNLRLDDSIKFRDALEKELKPDDITKAQQLATDLKIKIVQNVAIRDANQSKNKQVTSSSNNKYSQLQKPNPTTPAFTPNDIAIIIGIEKYRTVPPTEYAAADAGMVRDYLKALGIPERNIEFLADDRATLSDIRKVIETKLPNMVKANSRVIVYYAGHGAPGTARGESYLVPYDGDPSFLADTAYPLSRLYDRLSRLKAKEVLVILDSCFSGAGGRSVLAKNTRPLVMVKDTPPPASKNMIVLTSSRGSQITTSLSEVGHGTFTYFFLRALQEGNRDIGEVYAYLNPRVTEEAKRQNVDQTPTITPAADKLKGRFLFAR